MEVKMCFFTHLLPNILSQLKVQALPRILDKACGHWNSSMGLTITQEVSLEKPLGLHSNKLEQFLSLYGDLRIVL